MAKHLVSVTVTGVSKSSVTAPAIKPRIKWLYGFPLPKPSSHSKESCTLMVSWSGLGLYSITSAVPKPTHLKKFKDICFKISNGSIILSW